MSDITSKGEDHKHVCPPGFWSEAEKEIAALRLQVAVAREIISMTIGKMGWIERSSARAWLAANREEKSK